MPEIINNVTSHNEEVTNLEFLNQETAEVPSCGDTKVHNTILRNHAGQIALICSSILCFYLWSL